MKHEIKTILGTIHSEKCYLCRRDIMPWQAKPPVHGAVRCADVKSCRQQVMENEKKKLERRKS